MMRSFTFAVYVTAAGAQLWPIVIMAMSGAFSGVDTASVLFVSQFVGFICCITLLAAAGAAVLTDQHLSRALLLSGPILSILLGLSLPLTIFRGSENAVSLSAPSSLMALIAVSVGSLYLRMRRFQGV